MTTPAQDNIVDQEVRIKAKPETVFPFFTDPSLITRWQGVSAELDPRPGGIYRVSVQTQRVALGRYVEVTPYSRVVFTWGWEGPDSPIPPGGSTIEVTFTPDGDDTILRFRHSGFPNKEARDAHDEGWIHYLERLTIAAPGGDPGPDPWNQVEE